MNQSIETDNRGNKYNVAVSGYADELIDKYRAHPDTRILLGIIGAPAIGKSTFANDLVAQINERVPDTAIVVPMDGFHLPNEILRAQSTWEIKGRPETFDAQGFLQLLTALHDSPNQITKGPIFDRVTDEPVADGLIVEPRHKILIIEGNYLLLDTPPWDKAHGLLTEVWYLEAPQGNVVSERLRVRHKNRGLDEEEIKIKIASTDGPNTVLIESTKNRANRILRLPQDRRI